MWWQCPCQSPRFWPSWVPKWLQVQKWHGVTFYCCIVSHRLIDRLVDCSLPFCLSVATCIQVPWEGSRRESSSTVMLTSTVLFAPATEGHLSEIWRHITNIADVECLTRILFHFEPTVISTKYLSTYLLVWRARRDIYFSHIISTQGSESYLMSAVYLRYLSEIT